MIKRALIQAILLSVFLTMVIPIQMRGNKIESVEKNFITNIDWQLKSMTIHEKRKNFINHIVFQQKWKSIKDRFNRLKSKIGKEITGENIGTARQQYDFIVKEYTELVEKKTNDILMEVISNLNPHFFPFDNIHALVSICLVIETGKYYLKHNPPAPDPEMDRENACPEDVFKNGKAVISLGNSSLYQKGSIQYIKHITEAIRLFYEIASSDCLGKNSGIKTNAWREIDQKKMEIQEIIARLKSQDVTAREREAMLNSICREELALFQELDGQWVRELDFDISQFFEASEIRASANKKSASTLNQKVVVQKEVRKTETIKPLKKEEISKIQTGSMETPGDFHSLSLDVWQSAWGDFSEVDSLISYLRRNNIRKINLNPGLPMGPLFYQETYKKFKPLVSKFYAGGIKNIGFLYAELNYPIEFFAKFLYTHRREFKIDTIVDDSEFVDIFKDQFERNLRKVKQYGLKYSAFVTLESKGNSGVSDSTRYWVIDHIDYPVLMSYFGCTLEEQKAKLEKYLYYADQRGIKRRVGIAILLGSKKVGREESCERRLNESQMKRFLYRLHNWAIKNHPSYSGIVLETNLRMPKYDIRWIP